MYVFGDLLGNRPSTKPTVMVDALRDSEVEITNTTLDSESSFKEGQDQTNAVADDKDWASITATRTPIKRGKKRVCEDKVEQIHLKNLVIKTSFSLKKSG